MLDGFTVTGGQANGAAVSFDDRGGGMWINSGAPTLNNLKFTGNSAVQGGGLRVTSGSPTITNCSFISNSASDNVAGGGGLKSGAGSNVVCKGCTFRQNSITGASVGSAGIDSSGGLTLVNCIVAQNNPSGIHFVGDGNTVENCTIAYNTAYGVALINSFSNTMTNSIVWGNGTAGVSYNSAVMAVSYTDNQDGLDGGAGEISANPVFLAPPGDLRPGPGSPVVDAGNNAAVPVGVTTDIAGLPRFFDDPSVPDTGVGTPPIVDMGAHERVPLSVSAPASLALCSGADANFSVVAQGQPTLTYAWRKGGVPLVNGGRISGANTDSLTISATIPDDTGSYDVVVTDGVGQMLTSTAADLTVTDAPALPTITAPVSVTVASTGNTASVENHAGSAWFWALPGGTITGGQGTSQITSACDSVFGDVVCPSTFANWIERLYAEQITTGCSVSPLLYCPTDSVIRQQMAVFLLKTEHDPTYVPPDCASVFADVACPSLFANWIEQLYVENVTGGCATDPLRYCPSNPNTRGQMAVFLTKTFNLP